MYYGWRMYIHDPPPLNIGQLSSKLAHVSFTMGGGRIPLRNKEKIELSIFIGALMHIGGCWGPEFDSNVHLRYLIFIFKAVKQE